MYRKKIAIDLDGVIWDLVKPWILVYNILYMDNIKLTDITEYKLSHTLTKATSKEICDILLRPFFWELVFPFEESEEYLYKLNNEFDLYIATKTDYKLFEVKVDRLLNLFPFLNSEQIICIDNKGLLNVDWLVDDCVDNLKNGKFNKIILDATYNRKNTSFIRANNLKDVYNIIKYGDKNNG